jgi:hypothetical protein
MSRPIVSVAMTTYNGAAFLDEQLASIANQTRRPDELVVADDASTDHSVAIIERFATIVDFPVQIITADSNRGVLANVEIATTACRGDLIALADHDDRWYPTKLEVLVDAMAADRRNTLAFTDADLIDRSGAALDRSLWESVSFGPVEQRAVMGRDALFRLVGSHYVTGATAAFRAELLDIAFPVPDVGRDLTLTGEPFHIHDGWLAVIAAARGRVVPVPTRTMAYRVHAAQHTGVPAAGSERQRGPKPRRNIRPAFGPHIAVGTAAIERLSHGTTADKRQARELERRVNNAAFRSNLPTSPIRRTLSVLAEAARGGYGRSPRAVASVAKDLLHRYD